MQAPTPDPDAAPAASDDAIAHRQGLGNGHCRWQGEQQAPGWVQHIPYMCLIVAVGGKERKGIYKKNTAQAAHKLNA